MTFQPPAPHKHLLSQCLTLFWCSLMKATGAAVHWSSSQQTTTQTGDLKKETSPLVLCKLSKSCTHGIVQPCQHILHCRCCCYHGCCCCKAMSALLRLLTVKHQFAHMLPKSCCHCCKLQLDGDLHKTATSKASLCRTPVLVLKHVQTQHSSICDAL